MKRETIQERLDYWREQLKKLMDAYTALVDGGVSKYEIDDRSLTRFNLLTLRKQIDEAEKKVDLYENMLNGLKPRRVFGIVPRDW